MSPKNPTLVDRMLLAVWGALLGALIALGSLWWFDGAIAWHFVGVVAAASAVLAFALGRQFIEWLKTAFSAVWW